MLSCKPILFFTIATFCAPDFSYEPDTNPNWQVLGALFNTGDVYSVSFSPDGKWLADGRGYGWQNEMLLVGKEPRQQEPGQGRNWLYGPVRIWDISTGKPVTILENWRSVVQSVDWSPDGKTLAVGMTNDFGYSNGVDPTLHPGQEAPPHRSSSTVKLFDTQTWELKKSLDINDSNVNKVKFAPDSQRLAIGLNNYSVRLWNTENGKMERSFWGCNSWIQDFSFSPDGLTLATSGPFRQKTAVCFWNVKTGKLIRALVGENAISWAPDGRSFATSLNGTVKLRDADNGRLLTSIRPGSKVSQTAFAPDGKLLAAKLTTGRIIIWNRISSRMLISKSLYKLDGSVPRAPMIFSKRGHWFASGGGESRTLLLKLSGLS